MSCNIEQSGDSENSLKVLITSALPTISAEKVDNVLKLLTDVGVEVPEDITYVSFTDLQNSSLNTIQVRKLLDFAKTKFGNNTVEKERSLETSGNTSTSSIEDSISVVGIAHNVSCSRNYQQSTINWAQNYKVPVNIFSKKIQDTLISGKKLNSTMRNSVIRDLVNDAIKRATRPSRDDMRKIAANFISTFPNVGRDEVNGEIIEGGSHFFATKLIQRLENLSRESENTMPRVKDVAKSKKPRLCDDHSNEFRFNPEINANDLKECETIMKELQDLFTLTNPDQMIVQAKMKMTFPLQRVHINKGSEIQVLLKNWPFLFEIEGSKTHMLELLQSDVYKLFQDFFSLRSEVICQFFSRSKKKFCQETLTQLKENNPRDEQSLVGSVMLLLMNHFNEDFANIFPSFEPGTSHTDICAKLTPHPCLPILGESITKASQFILCVDKVVINDHLPGKDIVNALALLFGMYFILNIKYPKPGCASTLEFLQRYAAHINPQNKKEKVCPKVMGLLNKIGEMEWTQSFKKNTT